MSLAAWLDGSLVSGNDGARVQQVLRRADAEGEDELEHASRVHQESAVGARPCSPGETPRRQAGVSRPGAHDDDGSGYDRQTVTCPGW